MYVCMYVFVSDWLLLSDYLLIVCSCLYNSFDKFHVCFLQQFLWTYRNDICMYVCMAEEIMADL